MLPSDIPDTSGNDPGSPSDPATKPPAPDPASQQNFATRDEVLALAESVKAMASALQQGITAQPAPQLPAPLVDPTPQELIDDINSGKTDKLSALLSNHQKRLEQQFQSFQQRVDVNSQETARHNAYNSQDTLGSTYRRWTKEVDALVGQMPPSQRNALCYQTAIKMVRADHMDDIMKEEREKILRESQLTDGGSQPSGGGRQDNLPKGTPTVAELLGPEAERDMRTKGWTPDMYTEKILSRAYGVKKWVDAVPLIKEVMEGGANA